jgi:hypothetical protein
MKAKELIEILSEHPDYDVNVYVDHGFNTAFSTHFSVDTVEHREKFYLY